jgi:hypothetical protein
MLTGTPISGVMAEEQKLSSSEQLLAGLIKPATLHCPHDVYLIIDDCT